MSKIVPEKILLRITVKSIPELKDFAKKLQKVLPAKALVLLSGKMGSGKTELVKQVAELYNCKSVASPTFAFHHHYTGNIELDHWDLYRIESEEDLESTGFWPLLQESQGLVFVEWPEKIQGQWWPLDRETFLIQFSTENSERTIAVQKKN